MPSFDNEGSFIIGEATRPAPEEKPKRTRSGVSPVIAYVRSLGPEYKVASEVAEEVGVSVQAIRKYAKNPDLKAPSFVAPFGKLRIHLYTREDIKELQDFINGRKQVFKTSDLPAMAEPTALRDARINNTDSL